MLFSALLSGSRGISVSRLSLPRYFIGGYGLCTASATPSVVQCHLTTFSFTPGHTLSYATLDSDRHSQPRYVISIGRWILIWIIAYERTWHYTVGYWHDGRRVPLRYGLSSHTVDDPCFVRLSNNSLEVPLPWALHVFQMMLSFKIAQRCDCLIKSCSSRWVTGNSNTVPGRRSSHRKHKPVVEFFRG